MAHFWNNLANCAFKALHLSVLLVQSFTVFVNMGITLTRVGPNKHKTFCYLANDKVNKRNSLSKLGRLLLDPKFSKP